MCDFMSGYKFADGSLNFHDDAAVEAAHEAKGKGLIDWQDMVGHHGWKFCFGEPPAGSVEVEGPEFAANRDLRKFSKLMKAGGYLGLYFHAGQLHREDGPAIEQADGTKCWYRNGQLHREDGPAVEWADGTKKWYHNGQYHREDGPAIEWADGAKEWYRNGQRHRDDGPAIEWADGSKEWYRNGQRHREDGPAIENADGSKAWYRNGQCHRDEAIRPSHRHPVQ